MDTCAELAPMDGLIGQERALEATTFGIGMKSGGYNLFVLGPPARRRACGGSSTREQLKTIRAASAATVPPSA